jgi:UDP-GlcNAc:undecaprenyl-phosphate/decaprenyl-phosphate GlcNAc-1-phosphate transferase
MPDVAGFTVKFALAAAATIAVTPLVKRIAHRTGAVAMPKADRWHTTPVPLLGGTAIVLAVVAIAIATRHLRRELLPILAGGGAAWILGTVDDYIGLKPSTKLTGQIGIACGVLVLGTGLHWTSSAVLDALVTIGWIVAVTNAFNLLDNMDGLCAGIAAIAGLAFAGAIGPAESTFAVYAAMLAGAATGFLVYNFKPASIFLGDGGSLFLGSSFAILAVSSERDGASGVLSSVAVPALLLLIPLFDTAFVTVSRKLSARSASRGGRDHTSHRLVALGFSERQAVLILYALAGVAAATAVGLRRAALPETHIVLPLLVIVLVLLGVQLARVNVYGDGTDFSLLRNQRYTPLLVDVTYKRRLFEVLLDFALVTIAYYASYVVRFDTQFPEYYPLLVRSLPIVIGCYLTSFFVVGVYRGVWRYFSASDLSVYVKGIALGTVWSVLCLVYLYRFEGYSRGVFIINAMALGLLVVGTRASFRVFADAASRRRKTEHRVVIYGAGDGGAVVVRELRNNPAYEWQIVGFVDDDARKRGKRILGLPILGARGDLPRIFEQVRPTALIVSTTTMIPEVLAEVQSIAEEHRVAVLKLSISIEPVGSPVDRQSNPAPDDDEHVRTIRA